MKNKNKQIGGTHYEDMDIQPWEVMKAWLTPEEYIGYHKGSILSYISRDDIALVRKKMKYEDLFKAGSHSQELLNFIRKKDGHKEYD